VNDDFSDVYFALYALTAPDLPNRLLVREAERIRDRLARVDGVQKARILGERPQRFFVELHQAPLATLGVSPAEVRDALDAQNRLAPAGLVETDGPRLYVRPDAKLRELEDIRHVPLRVGEHLLTLGALIIALGLLVDHAIIAIEMMLVKMEAGWDRLRAAAHAWTVTAAPMLSGTLVTVIGFVPIGFARSGVGEYAGNILWVLAFALLASWVVAVTFTPYLGTVLLKPPPGGAHGSESAYATPLYRRLRGVIGGCVRYEIRVVAATVGLLILSIVGLAGSVQKPFFPSSDRPEVLIRWSCAGSPSRSARWSRPIRIRWIRIWTGASASPWCGLRSIRSACV
jgi:multidrug efflux pump subunit AcrB